MSLETQESVIAGGADKDNMTIRHLVMRGGQQQIGYFLGNLAKERYGYQVIPSRDARCTNVNREYLGQVWPAHSLRMRGLADAMGCDINDDSLDLSELSYSPGTPVPGCSNVYYPATESGHPMLSRNFDFSTDVVPVSTREPYLMEVYPDEGYSHLMMCAYDLLGGATDGINSEGLVVALLADIETALSLFEPDFAAGGYDYRGTFSFDGSEMTGDGVGPNDIQVVRYLLENCKDAEEARRALLTLKTYYKGTPLHYIVGDRHGDGFVFEGSMQGNIPQFYNAKGAPLAVTNHPLREHELADDDGVHHSQDRLDSLNAGIARHGEKPGISAIREIAEEVAAVLPAGEGQYKGELPSRTLWHGYYDLEERSVVINFYLHDVDESGEIDIRRTEDQRYQLQVG